MEMKGGATLKTKRVIKNQKLQEKRHAGDRYVRSPGNDAKYERIEKCKNQKNPKAKVPKKPKEIQQISATC